MLAHGATAAWLNQVNSLARSEERRRRQAAILDHIDRVREEPKKEIGRRIPPPREQAQRRGEEETAAAEISARTQRQGAATREPSRGSPKAVRFSTAEIREYSVVVGDHPACASLPLSLGWEHSGPEPILVDVDEYEDYRDRQCPRRTGGALVLSYYERRNRLREVAGLSEAEIFVAERRFLRDKRNDGLFLRGPLPPSGLVFADQHSRKSVRSS